MANEEAEKKDIAKLSFNIDDAINRLEKVDAALKNIANNSEKYGNIISKNLNNKLGGIINTDDIEKNANKAIVITKDMQEKAIKEDKVLRRHLIEQNNEANNKIRIQNNKTANEQILNNEKVAKSTETLYDKISKYAKTYIIYQGFNMLKQAASDVVDEMVNVEYKMVEIDRVMNVAGMDVDHFRDKLIQLAYDYGNSFDNVSDISLRLAQAGIKSQANLALTEKTLLALNTAELDATEATDDMVAVMSQWNLITDDATQTAKEYGDIIDKINKVADNFPTKSADILDAMKKTSNVFNLAGASINETIATIVAAEKASQRGGKAIGTALSNISQQIRAEGRLNLAEELGLNFFKDEAKTEFKNLIDIFKEMAERIQQLKDEGKESSVEMQKILELFTVFRRNIGASLLGEMAGEESTYAKVLQTAAESIGYSYQENEKYMKTAKAAQEQFNAELLKLKTSVWDNGVEDVFRSMLLLGGDVAKGIKFLTDTFGSVPTAIGAATLAFTAFNKDLKIATYNTETGKLELDGLFKKISEGTKAVRDANRGIVTLANNEGVMIGETQKGIKVFAKNAGETIKYGASLAGATLKTIGLEAATIALNAALSLGLSAAITLVISGINNLIHAEENAAKRAEEATNAAQDLLDKYEEERTSINSLIKEYEELAKKEERTPEDKIKIYEIQAKINSLVKDQKDAVDLVNGAYDETIKRLKEISKEELERSKNQAEITLKETRKQAEDYGNFGLNTFGPAFSRYGFDLAEIQKQVMGDKIFQRSIDEILKEANFEDSIRLLEEFKQKMEEANETSNDMYYQIISDLKTMYELQDKVNSATETYNYILAEEKVNEMFTEDSIQNLEDYKNALEEINSTDFGVEGLQAIMSEILSKTFPEFSKATQEASDNVQKLGETIELSFSDLDQLVSGYDTLIQALDEFNSTGAVTYDTLNSLINNNLLQYLDLSSDKLSINEAAFANAATAAKANAMYQIAAEAATQLATLAYGQQSTQIAGAEANTKGMTTETQNLYTKLVDIIPKILEGADAWQEYNKALGGTVNNLEGDALIQAQNIVANAANLTNMVRNMTVTSVSYQRTTGGTRGGGGSSSSSAAYSAQKEAEAAAKAAEEEYKKKLDAFKKYITEKERLEKRWVDKEKELGLLSNKDYLYITQQRIERYKQYLEEVRNASWMKDEDRLELEKSYLEKVEDLQVDYLGYLKDIQEDEIKALEKANDEKIDLIKEEADARIAALRAVESENDRIRDKEDYERRRAEHLEDISYWEQRTGRQAQEALKEAKEKLKELDEQWERQMQDWSIDDQIKAIEEERDAQVKAIEDAQEAEINSIKEVYDAKVKLFGETGQIIYEGSVLQSQNLYNAYKSNFIDPIKSELQDLNKVVVPEVQQATPTQEYETYLIKSGDTLSAIAGRYGTTVDKIMAANPYITNKNRIYAGKTLQIPKFHEGGIGEEGIAILKKNEMILKPEWTPGMLKLIKYIDKNFNTQGQSINGGDTIQVTRKFIKYRS